MHKFGRKRATFWASFYASLGEFSPIGRLFYFRAVFLISEIDKIHVLILPKNALGYILGDFLFTYSSGHPVDNMT
jgi:hypothetical protein